MQALEQEGFDISYVGVSSDGRVSVDDVMAAIRPETALVSVMHVNNETGMCQPLAELAQRMADHDAFLHVDAAQSFGKLTDGVLNDPRIDLISLSAHKLFGPKGVGALIARRRRYHRPPLRPLMHGGGQEAGLRPGTQPVALIAGLGTAAELAERERDRRDTSVRAFRDRALSSLGTLGAEVNGDPDHSVPHIVNASIPGVDAEALMLALKPLAAFSNGSACTSHSYTSSHVLTAMGLSEERVAGAIRLSWSHLTPEPDWPAIIAVAGRLRPQAPVVTS